MSTKFLTAGVAVAILVAPDASAQSEEVYGPPSENSPSIARAVELSPPPPGVPDPLAQAVEIAAREHPVVLRALADRRASASNLRGAKWQRFPSLSVEALAVTQGSQNAAQDGLAANLIVEQPVYTFGRIDSTIDAAEANLDSSTHAVADAQLEIALRTISAYYDLALATKRELILEASLKAHENLLATISRRVEQEVSPRADFELADSRAAQIEQELAAVAGLRATSFSRLQELIGYADLDLGGLPQVQLDLVIPSEDQLIALALECNPRLKALRSLRAEVDAERRIARSRVFPQILAQGSTNEITGTRFGLTLRLQTGNGLSQLSAIDAAQAQVVSAEFQLASTEREIRELIRADYLTFMAGKARALASERATRSSELVTESYRRQFITGRRTWLDVMNSVREEQTANLTEADARLGALAAYSRLMMRSCLWRPTPIGFDD